MASVEEIEEARQQLKKRALDLGKMMNQGNLSTVE